MISDIKYTNCSLSLDTINFNSKLTSSIKWTFHTRPKHQYKLQIFIKPSTYIPNPINFKMILFLEDLYTTTYNENILISDQKNMTLNFEAPSLLASFTISLLGDLSLYNENLIQITDQTVSNIIPSLLKGRTAHLIVV